MTRSAGTSPDLDLSACDREPIHIPGAIQPHGLLLVAQADTLSVVAAAGDVEGRLQREWIGRPLADLVGLSVELPLDQARSLGTVIPLGTVSGIHEQFDAVLHLSGGYALVELEPRPNIAQSPTATLSRLDAISTNFERAPDLQSLCERAAIAFRELTGFDRVMVYRFLEDDSGRVLAEDRDPALSSFLNHHFPASDIPKQARALYIRNRVRVIPDAGYQPAPIRPATPEIAAIDLSDAALRSVSPVHLQYLKNMGVAASASISIVKDGQLWGLIACHNRTPRRIGLDARIACRALAGGLARQIRAKEEAAAYRERMRLRSAEETLITGLRHHPSFVDWLAAEAEELRIYLSADGFAAIRHGQIIAAAGVHPDNPQMIALSRWLSERIKAQPLATHELGLEYAPAQAFASSASGLLAVELPAEDGAALMWFRVEQPQTVEWAGNPHKAALAPGGQLTPRNSFDIWAEQVRGRARRWTAGEIDAAGRLRRTLTEFGQAKRLRELNRQLGLSIAEKESLLSEKDHLLREMNHRVQNSLQLVQSFLALQANAANDQLVSEHLGEAQRRLSAVALVHRRLYQGDQIETVDLARYLHELIEDMAAAHGVEWRDALKLDLAPVSITADRAVHVGLIMTELVINANKYAYGGLAGPLAISLEEHPHQFRLIVADQGTGQVRERVGFGTRMMNAMVQRLGGTIERLDNEPGLRVVLVAPI